MGTVLKEITYKCCMLKEGALYHVNPRYANSLYFQNLKLAKYVAVKPKLEMKILLRLQIAFTSQKYLNKSIEKAYYFRQVNISFISLPWMLKLCIFRTESYLNMKQ